MHPFFEKHSDDLFDKRKQINDCMDALHRKREQGLSLYDCINRYLEIDGDLLSLSYNAVSHLTLDKVQEIRDQFIAMDKVVEILVIAACHRIDSLVRIGHGI